MPLTIAERKHRMPFGAMKAVASEQHVDPTYVSRVMNGEVYPKTEATRKKLRRVQVALARKLGVPVDVAFPPAHLAHGVAHTGSTPSGDDASEAHTADALRIPA